jgi:hypothetical protein
MNDLEAWQQILKEWKYVKRTKRLNQELYDQLFGSIQYIVEYSKKYGIPIPNRETLVNMSERIHYLMDMYIDRFGSNKTRKRKTCFRSLLQSR